MGVRVGRGVGCKWWKKGKDYGNGKHRYGLWITGVMGFEGHGLRKKGICTLIWAKGQRRRNGQEHCIARLAEAAREVMVKVDGMAILKRRDI